MREYENRSTMQAEEAPRGSIAELERRLALQTMLDTIKAVHDGELDTRAIEALRPLVLEAMQRIGKK